MAIQRTTLKQAPSGTVDLVWDGALLRIEFNCKCIDAVAFCRGMCCRKRVGFSVELEPDEFWKYKNREHPIHKGVFILESKPDESACFYFDEETSCCTIHDRKPKMCRAWGCSPGTEKEDAGIERRDAGWMLLPMRKEEADLIQIQQKKAI
jgi:Fe-S-cluster containining protein